MKLAIIAGVSEYRSLSKLNACKNDVNIINELFKKLNKFDDICLISDSPTALDAKNTITNFVDKHKSSDVSELVFYYTGHGGRFDDDFFYLFSDFTENKKETTGLRNTELDNLIRNLQPDLTIKIVDACHAGVSYIKSETDIKPYLEKSARENSLKNIYFFYSSGSDEESCASQDYSHFTLSFCKALIQSVGSIRYKDIMSYISDDMNSIYSYQTPVFVIQAQCTEIFGEIDDDLQTYIKETLSISNKDEVNSADGKTDIGDETSRGHNSLIDLVKDRSNAEYCTKEEAFKNIQIIRDILEKELWSTDITNLLNVVEIEIDSTRKIPNKNEIGRWLEQHSEENYFAVPETKSVKYSEQEYVRIPKKPLTGFAAMIGISMFGADDEYDYQLENVEKYRTIIDGFSYSIDPPFHALQFSFNPQHTAVEHYNLTLVILFSRNSVVVFSAKEVLPYKSWEDVACSKCLKWEVKKMMLKNASQITQFSNELKASVSSYILNDISSKLST